MRGEEPEAEDSRRFQPPNLGKAVRDAVGEMCPNPAPAADFGKTLLIAGFFCMRGLGTL